MFRGSWYVKLRWETDLHRYADDDQKRWGNEKDYNVWAGGNECVPISPALKWHWQTCCTVTAFRQISAKGRHRFDRSKWAKWVYDVDNGSFQHSTIYSFWILEFSVLAQAASFPQHGWLELPCRNRTWCWWAYLLIVDLTMLTIVAQSLSIGSFTPFLACICAYNI